MELIEAYEKVKRDGFELKDCFEGERNVMFFIKPIGMKETFYGGMYKVDKKNGEKMMLRLWDVDYNEFKRAKRIDVNILK